MAGRKGSRRRSPSKGSYHRKQVRAARTNDSMPHASDVEVRDANGTLVRIERSKKPLA